MKAVLIGAGEKSCRIIKKAQELGVNVIAVDQNENARGMKLADECRVADITDEKAVLEIAEELKPDFVLHDSQPQSILAAGAANEELGLKGISRRAAGYCADKGKMMKHLASRGLGDLIADKVFAGVEYGADGVMDGAAFNLVFLRKKVTVSRAGKLAGYISVPETSTAQQRLRDRVEGYMTQAATVLGLKNCLIHADLVITRNRIFMMGLSVSLSGNSVYDVFIPTASGVDMAEQYLRSRIGAPYSYQPVKTEQMLIHYFDLPAGTLIRVPERDMVEWFCAEKCGGIRLEMWVCHIRPGDVLEANADDQTVMDRGYFILSGESEEMLMVAAEGIGMFFRVDEEKEDSE